MNRKETNTFNRILCLSTVIVASYAQAALAQRCDPPAATVSSVQGAVEAQVVGKTTWQAMQLNDTYCPGDTIRVDQNSRADMSLANGSVMRLRADTTMTLEEVKENRISLISLLKGAAHFFSRRPNSLEVRTPYTVAGVRGTEFYIEVADNQTALHIFTGQVVARNEAGSLSLTGGHSAVAEKGKAPVLRVRRR
jgi:ferric-dicitrate binding protein FerR (iron transport regulator)